LFLRRAKKNCRTYPPLPDRPEEGELLNTWTVLVKNRLSRQQWITRRERAKEKELPLEVVPQRFGPYRATENSFFDSEVAAALDLTPVFPIPIAERKFKGEWIDLKTAKRNSDGKIFRTLLGTCNERPRLTQTSIWRYGLEPCRYLFDENGKKMRPMEAFKVKPPIGRSEPKVTIYSDDDAGVIEEKLSQNPPQDLQDLDPPQDLQDFGPVHREDDDDWLTNLQAQKKHGVPKGFCGYWNSRKSKLRRKQKALRAKKFANAKVGPGRSSVWRFKDGDIRNILRGDENEYPGMGKGKIAESLRRAMVDEVKKELPLLLPDHHTRLSKSDVCAEMKSRIDASPVYTEQAFNELRGVEKMEGRKPRGRIVWWSLPAKPNGERRQGPMANGQQCVSDRQMWLLGAMLRLKAVSRETRRRLPEIVKAAVGEQADPDSYKHDMADLARKGLIDTQDGRSGGSWLTQAGLLLAQK
jgi:hypothetical protein